LLLAAFVLANSGLARADTIRLTSGTVTFFPVFGGAADWNVAGEPQFGMKFFSDNFAPLDKCVFSPCHAGDRILWANGLIGGPLDNPVPLTLNGGSGLGFLGLGPFIGPSVVVPPHTGPFQILVPFVAPGSLLFFRNSGDPGSFLDVVASGTATLHFLPDAGQRGAFILDTAQLALGQGVAATPEPPGFRC
jgi:hypothetical protein